MGFLTGSLTFSRYEIVEDPTGEFGDRHFSILDENAIGTNEKVDLLTETDKGFTGGDHVFDTDFRFEKNIVGQALHFGIREDSVSIPSSIKRAWTKMELAGIMKDNLGGRPTKTQKVEAEEAVEQRCAAEAAKGNFKRMKVTSVLWDAATNVLFLASNSEKNNESCLGFLESKFGLLFRQLTPTQLVNNYCEDDTEAFENLQSVNTMAYVEQGGADVTWWNGMSENFDYLGNEFLLWLWWRWDTQSTVIDLSDETELSGMFTKTLTLDCPLGESGKETISSISPVALPEAMMAIRMGKLPRKAGLRITRDGEEFEFTIQAETFGVGAGRIVNAAESNPGNEVEVRLESIRQLCESLDLLFEAFLDHRLGGWPKESNKMRKWLAEETAARRVQVA